MNNGIYDFILENTLNFSDRSKLKEMSEYEFNKLSESTLHYLTESLKPKTLDFGQIPESKGNIQRVKGIENTIQSLNLIKENYRGNYVDNSNVVFVISDAINNIGRYQDIFTKAFKSDNKHMCHYYNMLVFASIAGTSLVLAGSLNITNVNSNGMESKIDLMKVDMKKLDSIYKFLLSFNQSCKDGSFRREGMKNITGAQSGVSLTGIAVGGLLLATIVPLMRHVIYAFYYSRMKLSDFLEQQALYIEANKEKLEKDRNLTPQEKEKIIKKQEEIIEKLRRISDKIKVDYAVASKKGREEEEEDNSNWSFSETNKKMNDDSMNDYDLL